MFKSHQPLANCPNQINGCMINKGMGKGLPVSSQGLEGSSPWCSQDMTSLAKGNVPQLLGSSCTIQSISKLITFYLSRNVPERFPKISDSIITLSIS